MPILKPLKFKILFAIPPTKTKLFNLFVRFLINPIFVDILDPPIMQVIGLSISDVIFFNALISDCSCNPANDGKNFVILETEA